MSKKDTKRCYMCKCELDPVKDKGKFVEAEGKVVCKRHHGVEKWYEKVTGLQEP
jgi:hypothetical protein